MSKFQRATKLKDLSRMAKAKAYVYVDREQASVYSDFDPKDSLLALHAFKQIFVGLKGHIKALEASVSKPKKRRANGKK